MNRPIAHLGIVELSRRLSSRETSARSLVEDALARIAARNGALNAFITVCAEEARREADRVDAEIAAGQYRGVLHGIPVSLKDLIDVRGVPTTAASRLRQNVVAASDAPIVTALRRAGTIIIGKCNLHEFAYGTTGEESAFGPTRNPWDLTRSPGGSSSGSAVAVATGMSVVSIGTDTGGSIRIPAAACGVVGLKPTWGEISCAGVVPLSPSLDHVGPLARSVQDAWLLYRCLVGDPQPTPIPDEALPAAADLTLGVLREYFCDVLDEAVRERFDAMLQRLARAGCRIVERVVAHARLVMPVYLHLQLPEAAAYHARTLDERPEDYSRGVRLRLELGRYVLAEDYVRAAEGRMVLRDAVDAALAGCDALVLPTLAVPAPPLGATTVQIGGRPESARAVMLRLTQAFNVTGHPAISLPGGRTVEGLPWGLQLVGRRHRTVDLVRVATTCERLIAFQEAPMD